jgi:hypothetical protein
MKTVKTLSLFALGLAALTLAGCNNNRDDDNDSASAPAAFDQVGEIRVYDERPAHVVRRQQVQSMPVRQSQQVVKSFKYNQIGETDITE